MIKVSFCSANIADDVCHILESSLTHQVDVEEWLMEKVPSIRFYCMDFPHDLESFYDCYFESDEEEADAYRVYHLLKNNLEKIVQVDFHISIVDEHLQYIKEISV